MSSGAVRTSSDYVEVVDEFRIQNSHELKRELGLKYSEAPGLAADSEIVCASVRCEPKDFDALVDAGNIVASNVTRVLFLTKGVAVSAAKRVLIVALVLLVSGAGAIGISLIPPSGPGPKYECVTDEPVSSGFSDPDQGDCPITIESHRARTRWENRGWLGESAYPVRKVAAGGVVLGIVGLIAAGIVKAAQPRKVVRPGM